ncbi:MAG TPA: lysylphosphatidylglycerol synthase transmembrane domain-containing protein [Kofleriaceae bacterium]|jgi:hypothetical protein|nr:lysylphosphatidylglycerol synthase transmembrane domain-containing protein [Kofleriaceae bacterium]
MRLAINLVLSLGMLALCTWLVWPNADTRNDLQHVFAAMQWGAVAPYLAGWLGLQIIVHLCRSLRWNDLFAPLGVRVPTGPLLAISSVGFMAILALPVRLGEFVRPGLLGKGGYSTAAAALGTVAVERIVDGLIISLLVFGAFFAHRGPDSPGWMMATAYGALALFTAALIFLAFALRWPAATVRLCLRLTLLPRYAPRVATTIEHRLLDMIRGCSVLKDVRRLLAFLIWSMAYWTANGLGVWVLARGFGLPLSPIGAFATMGLLGVGLMLPNSPGLVGQFQWFTLLGLSLYLGFDPDPHAAHPPVYAFAFAFAFTQYLLQVVWYVGTGLIGLATPWVSFHDLWAVRRPPPDDASAAASPAPPAAPSAQLPRATVEPSP